MHDQDADRRTAPARPRPRRPPLNRDVLQRAEQTFRDTLAPIIRRRRQRRLFVGCAFAAIALAAIVLDAVDKPLERHNPAEPVAKLVKSTGPIGIVGHPHTPVDSRSIRRNELIVTSSSGRALIDCGGRDIRVDTGTIVRCDGARLVLRRGMVYVDTSGAHWWQMSPLRIDTPFATLIGKGTQFIAQVDSDRLYVAVREGSVIVQSAM